MAVQASSEVLSRHDFNATYTNEYDSNQTNVSIVSPSSGKKLKIIGGYISLEGSATTGYVKLGFLNNTVIKVFAGSGTFFDFHDILIRHGSVKNNTAGHGHIPAVTIKLRHRIYLLK